MSLGNVVDPFKLGGPTGGKFDPLGAARRGFTNPAGFKKGSPLTIETLLSGGKTPPPLPVPSPLSITSEAVSAAAKAAIEAERKRKGRASTILTSGSGVDDDQLGIINRPQAQSATLLGG